MSGTTPWNPVLAVFFGVLLTTPATAAAQESAPTLNDAQIAHIAVTANAIDAEMGELASERARSGAVREFARRMITDHTAVNEQAAALAGKLSLTPQDNGVSRSLREGAAAARKLLEAAGEADFDQAYMEREVAYHRAVLQALDETLIPNAANAELKALLEQARGAVAAHLAHAEDLRRVIGGGKTHVVEMRNFEFSPARLEVAVGDTVVWVNRDAAPHTATDSTGGWGSGELKAGERWSRAIAAAGRDAYLCAYHPSMRGQLIARAIAPPSGIEP